jgi:hypothetical protein
LNSRPGRFEEDKLRHALYGRLPRAKKSRYIKLVLKSADWSVVLAKLFNRG